MLLTAGLRVLQILFSITILSIAVVLIKGQYQGAVPSQTSYAAFCGGLGLLISVVGLGALFIEFLQGLIMAALDGVTTLLVLAGGIALAVGLHGGSCYDIAYIYSNYIVRGADQIDGTPIWNPYVSLTGRCQQAQADAAFLFFAFIAFAATAVLSLMGRSGGTRPSYV